jgi:hypothetical protein
MSLATARWLDRIGKCVGCRKQAAGYLRDHRNDNLGPYCMRCADRAIKKAEKHNDRSPVHR